MGYVRSDLPRPQSRPCPETHRRGQPLRTGRSSDLYPRGVREACRLLGVLWGMSVLIFLAPNRVLVQKPTDEANRCELDALPIYIRAEYVKLAGYWVYYGVCPF